MGVIHIAGLLITVLRLLSITSGQLTNTCYCPNTTEYQNFVNGSLLRQTARSLCRTQLGPIYRVPSEFSVLSKVYNNANISHFTSSFSTIWHSFYRHPSQYGRFCWFDLFRIPGNESNNHDQRLDQCN